MSRETYEGIGTIHAAGERLAFVEYSLEVFLEPVNVHDRGVIRTRAPMVGLIIPRDVSISDLVRAGKVTLVFNDGRKIGLIVLDSNGNVQVTGEFY